MAAGEVIALDFETYYKSGSYSLGGARKKSTMQYIMDDEFLSQCLCSVNLMTGERLFSWYDEIAAHVAYLQLHDKTVLAHNAHFDGAILAWVYDTFAAHYMCTQAISMGVYGSALQSHSLDGLTRHLGCAPKKKSMLKEFDGVRQIPGHVDDPETAAGRMREYCEQDVDSMVDAFRTMYRDEPQAFNAQLWSVDWTVKQFVDPMLMLDEPLLAQTVKDIAAREKKIFAALPFPKTDFSSSVKFAKILEQFQIPVPMKWSDKQQKEIPALAKTDEGFNEMLLSPNKHIRNLAQLRQLSASNIERTRTKSLHDHATLHPQNLWPLHVRSSGAMATHRLSGSDGAGGNPLNLPRGSLLRRAIKPKPGYRFFTVDQSGFELRIARTLAQDTVALEILLAGGDLYIDFAEQVYDRALTKDDEEERHVGKESQLSLQYGVGAATFDKKLRQSQIFLDAEMIKTTVSLFRYNRHVAVSNYWKQCQNEIIPFMLANNGTSRMMPGVDFMEVQGHHIRLPSGNKIDFHGLKVQDGETVFRCYNSKTRGWDKIYPAKMYQYCCQSLANEILVEKKQQIESDLGFRVAMEVYDEVTTVVPDNLTEADYADVQKRIEQIMSLPPTWWPNLVLKNEGKYANNYGEAK